MSPHRLVALASVTTLLGLLGAAASASNHVPFSAKAGKGAAKPAAAAPQTSLREKIRNANIDGCGG